MRWFSYILKFMNNIFLAFWDKLPLKREKYVQFWCSFLKQLILLCMISSTNSYYEIKKHNYTKLLHCFTFLGSWGSFPCKLCSIMGVCASLQKICCIILPLEADSQYLHEPWWQNKHGYNSFLRIIDDQLRVWGWLSDIREDPHMV